MTGVQTCALPIFNVQLLSGNYPSRAKRILQKNDILISSVRPNLKHNYFVKLCRPNLIASTGFIQLRCDRKKVNPLYLYYFLTSSRNVEKYVAIASTSQTTFPAFSKDVIENIAIPNVSLEEQHHIVDTIGSIDDLIENLNTINCKINDLIQVMFRKHTHHLNTTRIGNLKGYSIIKSGIETFGGTKVYLDTASVNENGISSSDYIITMKDKPSRANMQPISNSVWFAKLKNSPKFLYVRDFMEDILNKYIFSTGFLGLVCDNSYISNFMYSLITSKQFDDNKNALSIGATMQGINNDSFKEIQVPNVNLDLMTTIGKEVESKIKTIYYNKKKIEGLTFLKKIYLKKFFG